MHIELIGSTSAGKTTLAKKMVEAGKNNGVSVSLSDDFMLEQLNLSWVRNEFMRRRLVEATAFAICLMSLARHKDFFRFVVREGRSYPGSWFYKLNRIRNVLRKIGIFEFISRRAGSQQIILADNEGILQGVHNLFVHQNSQADLDKIARYAELVPMPDVILYLQQEEDVLISRTLGRGHARVAASSPDYVMHFIRQAVAVFDELINVPRIRERLLIVDGEWNVLRKADPSLNMNLHRVTELVRHGQ
jgi:thymidylate kinase